MINERDCFTERTDTKPMSLACPQCRHRDDYPRKWARRTRQERPPGNADARDKALFDGRNLYDAAQVRKAGLRYRGIGRGAT